ncbi:MAG: hypothetical protein ACRENJ_03885 [Candidatus Eiseniibacteriota bacterium]
MAALSPVARRDPSPPSAVWVVAGLLAFLLTQYAAAFSIPFINDDYVFLDKTRAAGFLDLWRFDSLTFHWYRPWSRELHYWTVQRLFGTDEVPFHVASLALWLAVLTSFWALARRLSGTGAAAVAVAGVAAMAAWGVPLLWVAGVQELWMLLFTLLAVHASLSGRRLLAAAALVGGLLSKETAAVIAPLTIACAVMIEGRKPGPALRRALPLLVIVAVWALVHPVLGGRLRHPFPEPLESASAPGPMTLVRAALVSVNLDALPRPEHGWGQALVPGVIGALVLGVMVVIGARRPAAPVGAPRARIGLGVLWALIGWSPLLMPSLGWHAYYALLGCFGVWLALAPLVARRPAVATALVVALACLRPARADTPSLDWGSEWYQRRAAEFIVAMRGQLREAHPRLPRHARLFFVRVPSNVGFLAGDGPALRVWYRDPTLRAGYYSSYRPRDPGDPAGPDLFFRFDSTGGWVEVLPGAEDVARARRANPRWEKDHVMLAATLARAGDWPRAAAEYAKLAAAVPARFEYAFDAGVCFESLGDSTAAAEWYRRAAALPGADAEARSSAERFAHLRGRR